MGPGAALTGPRPGQKLRMERLGADAAAGADGAAGGVAAPLARRGRGGSVGHIATPPVPIVAYRPARADGGGSGGSAGGDSGGGHSGSGDDNDIDRVVGGGRWPPTSWTFSPADRGRRVASGVAGDGGRSDDSAPWSSVDAGSSSDSNFRGTRVDTRMTASIQPSSSLSASLRERFKSLRADLLRLRSFFATDGEEEEDSHGSDGHRRVGRSGGSGAAGESFFSTGDGGGGSSALSRHPSLMPAPGGFDDNAAKLRLEVMTAGEVNVSIGALYVTLLVALAYALLATGSASASWAALPDGASAAAVATALGPSFLSRAAAVTINVTGVGVAALFLLALAAVPPAERTEEQVWTAVLLGAGLLCTSPMTLAGLPTDLPTDTPVTLVAITRPAAAALRSLLAPAWPAAADLFPPLSTSGLLRILTDAVYTASATFYLLSASHSYRLLLRPGTQLERARFYAPKVAAVVVVFLIKGVLAAAAGVSLGFVPFARMLSVFRLARVGELPPLVGAAALAAVILDVAIAFSTLSAMRATGQALAAQPYAETRTKQLGFRCFAYQTPACATAMICLRLLTVARLPIEVLVLTARPPPPSLADASLVPPVANLGIAAVYITSTTLAAYMNLPAGLWRDVEVSTALAGPAELQPSSAGASGFLGPSTATSSTAPAPSLSAGGRVPLLLERSLARVFFTAIHRVFSGRDQPATPAVRDNPERVPLLAGHRLRRVRLPSSALTTSGKGIPWGRDMPLRYRHREWRVLNGGIRDDVGGREGVSGGGRVCRPGRGARPRRDLSAMDSSSASDIDGADDGSSRVSSARRPSGRSQRHRRRRRRRGFDRDHRPPPPSMVGTYPSVPATSVGSFGDYLGGLDVDIDGDEPVVGRGLQRVSLRGRTTSNRLRHHSTLAQWERSLLDADPDRGCYFRLGMKKNVLVMQTVVLMVNCAYLAYIPGNPREELVPPPPSPPRPPRPPPRPPPPASMATEGADELVALLAQERHDQLLAGRDGSGNKSSVGVFDAPVSARRGGEVAGSSAPFAVPSRRVLPPSTSSIALHGDGTTAGGSGGRLTVSQPHSWSRMSSMPPALSGGATTDTWGRRSLGASSRVPSLMSSPALDTWGRRPLLPSTGHSSIASPASGVGAPEGGVFFGGGGGGVDGVSPGPSAGREFGTGVGGSSTAATAAATTAGPSSLASFASADGLRIDPFALAASRGYLVARYITAPSLSAHALVLVSVDRVVVTFSGTRDATNWAANLEVSSTPFDDLFSDDLPLDAAIYADREGGGAVGGGLGEKGGGGTASRGAAPSVPSVDGAASSSAAAPAAAAPGVVDEASYGSVSSAGQPHRGIGASPSLFAGGERPVSEDKADAGGLPPPASSGGLAAFAKDVLTLGQASVHGGHARVYKQLRPDVLSVVANLYAPPERTASAGAGGRRRRGRSGGGFAQGESFVSSSNGGGGRDWTYPGESSDADTSPVDNDSVGSGSARGSRSCSNDEDSSDDSSCDSVDSSSSTDSQSHESGAPPPPDPYSARTAYVASRWRGRGRGKPIFFTGHSMGGSLATLASYEAARHWRQLGLGSAEDVAVTTFGAPRVGNSAFALRYDATVATHWRVVIAADPVVRQPRLLGYHHVGVEVLLDRAGRLVVDPSFVETAWWASAVGATTGYRLHFRASYVLAVKAACRAYRGGTDDLADDFWPFVLGEHVHRLFRVSGAERAEEEGRGRGGGGATTATGVDQV